MKAGFQFLLMFAVAGGAVMHLTCWFAAYHSVPKSDPRARAAVGFNPWWMFRKNLLPTEHGHWRTKALAGVIGYSVAGVLLWSLGFYKL